MRQLVFTLKRDRVLNLDKELLFQLLLAGLNAPGFSERQRWELLEAAEYRGDDIRLSPLSQWWPWEALGRRAGVPEDVIEVSDVHLHVLLVSLR